MELAYSKRESLLVVATSIFIALKIFFLGFWFATNAGDSSILYAIALWSVIAAFLSSPLLAPLFLFREKTKIRVALALFSGLYALAFVVFILYSIRPSFELSASWNSLSKAMDWIILVLLFISGLIHFKLIKNSIK